MSAPDGFSIYAGAGFITMDQSKRDHFQTDPLIKSSFSASAQRVTMFLMVPVANGMLNTLDRISWRAIDADGTNSVESYNHRLKIFAILDSCLDVFRK